MNWADQADCLLKLQLIGVCKNLEILLKTETEKYFQFFFRYSDVYTLTSQTKVQKLILKTTILSTVIFLPRIFFLKYKLRQIIAVFFFLREIVYLKNMAKIVVHIIEKMENLILADPLHPSPSQVQT